MYITVLADRFADLVLLASCFDSVPKTVQILLSYIFVSLEVNVVSVSS